MIQINLLPDVKQEYLRTRRIRNTAISIAIITGLAAGGVVVLLTLVLGAQLTREIVADDQIKKQYAEMSQVDSLSELVTLQNQLELISSQHENKSVDSRLFSFLQAINPAAPNDVQFSSVNLDPSDFTITLEGLTDGGYPAVESLTKTIMNTKVEYVSGQEEMTDSVASQVAISETRFGEDSSGKRVLRFKIVVDYYEQLFVNTAKSVEIVGPDRRIDVTDSKVGVPDSLFTAPIEDEEE